MPFSKGASTSGTSGGISSGTSFPGSPSTNDLYNRTDILGGTIFKYDGTRWRTEATFAQTFNILDAACFTGLTLTTAATARAMSIYKGTYTIYCLTIHCHTLVQTTNDGSNNWTVAASTISSSTALGNFTTAADSVGVHTYHALNVNAVLTSTDVYTQLAATKNSAPGNFFLGGAVMTYQLVAT